MVGMTKVTYLQPPPTMYETIPYLIKAKFVPIGFVTVQIAPEIRQFKAKIMRNLRFFVSVHGYRLSVYGFIEKPCNA